MPVYREPFNLSDASNDLHLLDFSTRFKDASLNGRSLLCASECMTFGTKNIVHLPVEFKKRAFRKGQIYEGYFIRTINGPYDYCYKIWTRRQWPFAPLNAPIPNKEEFVDAVIIDRNSGVFGIACGGNMAFCTGETLSKAGIHPEKVILPMTGLKVQLKRLHIKRPTEIPYAAFEAITIVMSSPTPSNQREKVATAPLSVIVEENLPSQSKVEGDIMLQGRKLLPHLDITNKGMRENMANIDNLGVNNSSIAKCEVNLDFDKPTIQSSSQAKEGSIFNHGGRFLGDNLKEEIPMIDSSYLSSNNIACSSHLDTSSLLQNISLNTIPLATSDITKSSTDSITALMGDLSSSNVTCLESIARSNLNVSSITNDCTIYDAESMLISPNITINKTLVEAHHITCTESPSVFVDKNVNNSEDQNSALLLQRNKFSGCFADNQSCTKNSNDISKDILDVQNAIQLSENKCEILEGNERNMQMAEECDISMRSVVIDVSGSTPKNQKYSDIPLVSETIEPSASYPIDNLNSNCTTNLSPKYLLDNISESKLPECNLEKIWKNSPHIEENNLCRFTSSDSEQPISSKTEIIEVNGQSSCSQNKPGNVDIVTIKYQSLSPEVSLGNIKQIINNPTTDNIPVIIGENSTEFENTFDENTSFNNHQNDQTCIQEQIKEILTGDAETEHIFGPEVAASLSVDDIEYSNKIDIVVSHPETAVYSPLKQLPEESEQSDYKHENSENVSTNINSINSNSKEVTNQPSSGITADECSREDLNSVQVISDLSRQELSLQNMTREQSNNFNTEETVIPSIKIESVDSSELSTDVINTTGAPLTDNEIEDPLNLLTAKKCDSLPDNVAAKISIEVTPPKALHDSADSEFYTTCHTTPGSPDFHTPKSEDLNNHKDLHTPPSSPLLEN